MPQREDRPERAYLWHLPAGLFLTYLTWYARGLAGAGPGDPGEPAALRWWASRLLLLGGLFGTLYATSLADSWLAGLLVAPLAGGGSFAVARWGPGLHEP